MQTEQLKAFLSGVSLYFDKLSSSAAEMGIPRIKDDDEDFLLDYNGVIGISGNFQGAICLSVSTAFLAQLYLQLTRGKEPTPERLSDLIGELANTVAGNAQQAFESGFDISIPMVIRGTEQQAKLDFKAPTYITPFRWNEHSAHLVFGLKS